MPPMENSETGAQKQAPMSQTNPPSSNRRRPYLRSETADIFLRILSICSVDTSHLTQYSDRGSSQIVSETEKKDNVPIACSDAVPNDTSCQKEVSMDETRVALSTQEGSLGTKHVESIEQDHNVSGEIKDLSDTNPSHTIDFKNLKNHNIIEDQITIPVTPKSVTDLMKSSPQLPQDVEEGEISGEFTNFFPEDDILSETEGSTGIETGLENNKVGDAVKDIAPVVANKTERKLVDYSEVAPVHGKSLEFDRASIHPQRVLPLKNILKNSATKNKDFESPVKDTDTQHNNKRHRSFTEDKITNKKAKTSIDQTASLDKSMLVADPADASEDDDVDASTNKDGDKEKKKKQGMSKERRARKKRKERTKRAEKNRELGVKRLKIQPVIKEKIISYCRHFLQGRCHEGEKCNFSHDTIPLTKSKPCCHFARHSCMKGDDCPFDHQLSKYPCSNLLSQGFCTRGSGCLFSHEALPSETPMNVESTLDQNPSPLVDNSCSKKQNNNVDGSSRKKTNTNSCSLPEKNLVEKTPKISVRPPKGITFLSQEKLPLQPGSSPKVDSAPDVVPSPKEITKTPLAIPRGINFLSFGKKPHSNSGFSFEVGNKIGKSPLSNVENEGSKSDAKKTNSEIPTDESSSTLKPMRMVPFMSIASRRSLQSTIAFASGVKTNRLLNSTKKL